ncbi:CYTH and CHAD domain-containing protein [Kitasatospora sp. NPDC003701]
MSTSHVETERKFEVASGAECGSPPPLDELPGVADVRTAGTQRLDAVYYDTPDLRLLAHRVTLRRRLGGADPGWHLKLPRATDTRQEIRLPLAAGAADRIPPELAAEVAALVRGRPLAPVAHLRTHRERRLLLDGGGRELAEVTRDRVTARSLDAPGPLHADPQQDGEPPGSEPTSWTEFEVELSHGHQGLLDDVERALAATGIVRSAYPSKLAHALTATRTGDGAAHPEPPGDGVGAVVVRRLREQVDTLLALDPAVRDDEPDAVHRMRVTTRRLRGTLKAYRRLFDRRRSERLSDGLRRLGRVLGAARDHEVLGELLTARLDEVPARARQGALRGQLTAWSAREYREAWQRAVTELGSDRYYALLDDLESFVADPPLTPRADRSPRAELARTLRREQDRTIRRLDAALDLAPGPAQDEALHGARKAAKRARYAAEAARPVTGKPARRVIRRTKKLQQALGAHQDSVVARRALLALAAPDGGTGPGPEHGFAYGVLYALQQRSAEAAVEELPALRSRVLRH